MKNSKINVWLVIALLCLHVGVLAKGGRGSGGRSSSSRSSSSRSSSSGSSRSSSSGSSWHSSSSSSYGSSRSSYSPSSSSWGSSSRSSSSPSYSSSRSSYSPSSSSWGSSSRSSSSPSYSSSRSSYSPSSSSSYSYNSNTASSKSTSGGGIWQSIKNFLGFGSSHSSSSSSSSNQSKNIPTPTGISNTSPSHSLSSSTSPNQRSSSISGNTLNAHQRLSHAPSEPDSRNLNIRRNVTSSASNTLNAPSRLFNGTPALNGTLFNRPSNAHTNISASNVATVQSLYSAPLPTTSYSNHNQASATSNGRFWSFYGGHYNGGLHHTHSYHSGSNWETPTYSSEVSSDNTPDSYYTSSGYSSGTGTASYLPSDKENNDEDSGKSRIQKTCTEILNSEGRISELLKKICSPYAANNSPSTTTTSAPITGTEETTTISPTTLTPCGYTSAVVQEKNSTLIKQGSEPPKIVCRKVQQSVFNEHDKLVESIKEICEPDTTNTTTIPTICSRPTETITTAKPVVEPKFSIILPPTPNAR